MKILNWILCFLFLLSAVLQYNDPDPVIWMLMWGATGVACLLFALKKLPNLMPMIVGGIALVWALILLPKIIGTYEDILWNEVFMQASMSNITVEWVREMGGLLIIAIWMGVLLCVGRKTA
ncbi:MAG: transmembrane 220 family protein [Verrucomicrobia bacterium]|nr:transmembrane 220 family protein [Verrucomicrobiota bacterium]MDA1068323.1 transmembrane 220 family protein [Verrucomicrobiota bacterium]